MPAPPRPRARGALLTLLSMPREVFLERYWTSRPLFVRGSPSRLPALFRAPQAQTLGGLLGASPTSVRTWFVDPRGAERSVEIPAGAAAELYLSRRLTVVVDGVRIPA